MKIIKKVKNKAKLTNSSARWLDRNARDKYSKLAKQNNLRSRAAYKLEEINRKFNVLKNAKFVLDLGAYPGSWLQYMKGVVKSDCQLIGVDLKLIESIERVKIIQGDFTSAEVQAKLEEIVLRNGGGFDLICSDMAPSTSGTRSINHINIMNLAEAVFLFSEEFLGERGNLVIKLFEGNTTKLFFNRLKERFSKVSFFKPSASYSDSSEIFIIAKDKIVSK
ncbi:RlmE family RNA methyltransferase [Candidatus Bandiella euplotis]|uniref:Ribosomal RNA large subunit methyltransferase E n=1 Tax=Candidatus Bandiella euplotis TaxID=1664265 RepID=A0ABZ0ULH8_9RICK|nr:RlmE family RNA methyltransferase [Candidatus Bandiella woodruffii]WPX96106.1 Ribosomal RNA large subunit methyltransferase E [Candidatus Bandiella woodruffii]